MNNVLVVCGHPDLENSTANKIILEELQARMPGIAVDCVAGLYPDGVIDAACEQAKLLQADAVAFQYPLYWYGMPAALQNWIETVFRHGFSHGRTGNKLRGKKLVASFTMAASESQCKDQGFSPNELVDTQKRIARYAGMEWGGYVATGGICYTPGGSRESRLMTEKLAADHVDRLIGLLEAM